MKDSRGEAEVPSVNVCETIATLSYYFNLYKGSEKCDSSVISTYMTFVARGSSCTMIPHMIRWISRVVVLIDESLFRHKS